MNGNTIGATYRDDKWWVQPVAVLAGLTAFVIYTTWAGMQGAYYYYAPYLSPLYSPLIYVKLGVPGGAPLSHALLGAWPAWWPDFFLMPASPSILIVAFPGLFRLTCYYYRKSYYRAFTWTPPACSVGPLHQKNYKGETGILTLQNFHRYTLPFAVILIFILYYDAGLAFFKDGKFGFGVGTLVMLINPTLLGAYTFGCHSFRHLIGGDLNCYSCSHAGKARYGLWKKVTFLNDRHQLFAWLSLFWVGFTDFYIRMVSMGIFTDYNTWS